MNSTTSIRREDMTRQELIQEAVWIYAARQEINQEDVELLEALHDQALTDLAGGASHPIADSFLCQQLYLPVGSTFVECVAHILDEIFDTPGDHLEAIRSLIQEEVAQ